MEGFTLLHQSVKVYQKENLVTWYLMTKGMLIGIQVITFL